MELDSEEEAERIIRQLSAEMKLEESEVEGDRGRGVTSGGRVDDLGLPDVPGDFARMAK